MSQAQRTVRRLPVTTLASGCELALVLHEIRGSRPGPVVGITGAVHGDETVGVEVIRRLSHTVNPEEMTGSLWLIPVANPLAYEALTRNTPLDMHNLNRVFPGDRGGWLTEKIADTLTREFLDKVDVYIDLHGGGALALVDYVYILNDEGLSRSFGSRLLYRPEHPYEGTSNSIARTRGIPCCTVELGGGWTDEESYVRRGLRGCLNALRYLGVIRGEPEPPGRQVVLREIATIRPSVGGTLVPEVGADMITRTVPQGQVLARIYNPHTFEEAEVIRAPFPENAMVLLMPGIRRVNPGDYAYMVGNMATAEVYE